MSKEKEIQTIGVIGAGSFGTAIANLIAHNAKVLLYARNKEVVDSINATHRHLEVDLSEKITAINDLERLANSCTLLFAVVPSTNFRDMMRKLSPYLRPYHIMIHGTKGFDLTDVDIENLGEENINRSNVHTMSEVVRQESTVVRVGCLSGPNLSSEIHAGQPTATVIASKFKEVIKAGESVLNSSKFHVYGSYDMMGAELSGVLKNAIALGSGVLSGRGMGKNIQAMLITRGLVEMIYFGKAMGADSRAFLGTAGIGDLVATATSSNSRNFTFGYRYGQGESMEAIMETMPELAEGVRTIQIMKSLADSYKIRVPITQMLHSVIYEDFDIDRALGYLIKFPYGVDVDFL